MTKGRGASKGKAAAGNHGVGQGPGAVTGVTTSGRTIAWEPAPFAQGGMKDVYRSSQGDEVVAFFRETPDQQGRDRLDAIVDTYRKGIFEREGGAYWKDYFCWPTDTIVHDGRVGIVVPVYARHFFFEHGSLNGDMLAIKGREKEGKWFASANNRFKFLAPEERGDWLGYLKACLRISRAVRRLHAAGLAHSDLSYKNVLIDPVGGNACIIDIDGLVVPGKFAPAVVGTPDFIAPEVVATQNLDRTDPARKLPSINTDRHALAVLIYMYLLGRHPLKGGKIHDANDAEKDSELEMGRGALYVEHPSDASNRVKPGLLKSAEQLWGDPARLPATAAGPHLEPLFRQAFVDGLHHPDRRPTANDWEEAIVRTADLLQRCLERSCEMGWYPFDNTRKPRCPCCGTPARGRIPVLNLYSRRGDQYKPDNYRVMVWDGQSLFPWHANRRVFPNERLSAEQQKRVAYFQEHDGEWYLINCTMPAMRVLNTKTDIKIGQGVRLDDGVQILLDPGDGGRLVHVQLVGSS